MKAQRKVRQHNGRIEVGPGLQYLADLRETVARAWRSACAHDGIDPSNTFVIFSEDNPFAPFVDEAVAQYEAARAEYQAGGYVGLRIV